MQIVSCSLSWRLGVGLGVQSVTTISSHRDPAHGRRRLAWKEIPPPPCFCCPVGNGTRSRGGRLQKDRAWGWGRVLICLHGDSDSRRTSRTRQWVWDTDTLRWLAFYLGPAGLPRPRGNQGTRGTPVRARRKGSRAGEQDAVHARATGSRVPPMYVTRATCARRKHVTSRKSASTSASNCPRIPRGAGWASAGSLGGAAGRAAARPLEAPGGTVPRRLSDHLPGSGGFRSARPKRDVADPARKERRGAGRLCFLEASSKRRARVLRAVLGRSRDGRCVHGRAPGPVAWDTSWDSTEGVSTRPTAAGLCGGVLERFRGPSICVTSPLWPAVLSVALTPKLSHTLFSRTEIVSVNTSLLPIKDEVGVMYFFSFYFCPAKSAGRPPGPKTALPSAPLGLWLPTLPSYPEGSRPAPPGCGAYENDGCRKFPEP